MLRPAVSLGCSAKKRQVSRHKAWDKLEYSGGCFLEERGEPPRLVDR
jgi:hypothetical protein